jgi:hypothetical protein
MKRFWITIWLIGGALLLGCALLVPAHFRAVDSAVVARAGQERPGASAPTLVEEGITLLSMEKLGPARMLLRSAQSEGVPRSDWLASAVARAPSSGDLVVAARRPAAAGIYLAQQWGSAAGLLDIASAVIRPFGAAPKASAQVVLGWRLVEREQRTRTLFERMPAEPYVQELPRRIHGEDCD